MNRPDYQQQFKNAKERVRHLLSADTRCRNDDKWLVFKYLELIGQDITRQETESGSVILWRIKEEDIGSVPSFETIRRVRAEIQNKDGDYLPTDAQALIERKIKEDAVRRYYGDGGVLSEYRELLYDIRWYNEK